MKSSGLSRQTVENRLLKRTERRGACLIWTGATNGKQGYGKLWDGVRSEYVHRIAYRLWIGPTTPGLTIDHVLEKGCTSRLCVEPSHLEEVTLAVNHSRRPKPIRCPQGHDYTEENIYLQGSVRTCRRCHADREKDRRKEIVDNPED